MPSCFLCNGIALKGSWLFAFLIEINVAFGFVV